jgi:hypothetical protein
LDLFEGQLSFGEIYSMPVRNLANLVEARVRLIEKKEKIRQRLLEESEKEGNRKR